MTLTLEQLQSAMLAAGAKNLYAKVLAPNDNNKNQPYFGRHFDTLNILPAGTPTERKGGERKRPTFEAALKFSWLDEDGSTCPAPHAKLLLYPKYAEVRFSGYLSGCDRAPRDLMGGDRVAGRLLFLGVTEAGTVVGYAAPPDSAISRAFHALGTLPNVGVFSIVPLAPRRTADADKATLLAELCRISNTGWIESKALTKGQIVPYQALNGGGYTLEAELGISRNGRAEPDFLGWEVKQFGVNNFRSNVAGRVSLMSPEPTGGFYQDAGGIAFTRRYGYADVSGKADRINVGGTHRFSRECRRTGLTLGLPGFDIASQMITDLSAGITLLDRDGELAAVWSYAQMLAHWKKKHALAVYVPSLVQRDSNGIRYRYSQSPRLGVGTDFFKFLNAIANGAVIWDPGIKLENASTVPKLHPRGPFRIPARQLSTLYDSYTTIDACNP